MHLKQLTQNFADQPPASADDSRTDRLTAKFLRDCREIEVWSSDDREFPRAFSEYSTARVTGLSKSPGPSTDDNGCDVGQSHVEGIYLRGVLEQRRHWPQILRNALTSFTHKMVVVVCTPFSETPETGEEAEFPNGRATRVPSISHTEFTAVLQSVGGVICRVERQGRQGGQTAFPKAEKASDPEHNRARLPGENHLFFLERSRPIPASGSLTIHCTTTGRDTLTAMLDSIRSQQLGPNDEVLLIQDGPAIESVRSAWDAAQLPGLLINLPEGPHHDFGHSPRNQTLGYARGEYVLNLDDDDQLAPDALNVVRTAIRSAPGSFFFVQVELPDGALYWNRRELRWGNIGNSMFVAPTDIRHGTRGNIACGDYYYILETLALNPIRPVCWVDQRVFLIRPHTGGLS